MKNFLFILFLFGSLNLTAQQDLDTNSIDSYLNTTLEKSEKLEKNIDRTTEKYLQQLDKIEKKILKKLKDSVSNNFKFSKNVKKLQQYNPDIDTLNTVFNFIKNLHPDISKDLLDKHHESFNSLSSSLQNATDAEGFIANKIQYLKGLVDVKQLDKGLLREFKELNKLKYYYGQELNQYKEMLKDRKKIEKKVLSLLRKSKLFQDFSQKHSWFNSLFPPMPTDLSNVDLSQFGNLQNNQQITNFLQSQMSGGGPNAQANFQQQMADAQQQMTQLQNRVFEGFGTGDADLPPFKPNQQKTKSLFDRLEYNFNIQNNRSNQLYPTHSNISLGLGYKLSDNKIIGILGIYQLGLGEFFNDIKFSSQGIGGSAYSEIKLKGSFWLYSAFEINRKLELVNSPMEYNNDWMKSAYIGLSKSVPIKNQLFKAMKVQLLWDFLAHQQYPTRQALNFRVSFAK